MEGERKQVTVLFADLKGSMELLADRDAEEARKLLDPVLERMMEAVHHYDGTVNQVMGDGIMALFGAPLAQEDHAVRACYAALLMQESVRHYAAEVRRDEGVLIQIRVGINSGEVVVRSVGSDLRMDYSAVGQTTHLASRLEQLAAPGTTALSAGTLQLVEGYVQVRSLGPMRIKGLEAPIDVYELTGAGSARTRLQATALRGMTRFVGRDSEMEALRRAIEQAGAGHGQVVCVVGEPGVGKSRLYHEFTHSHRTQGWLVLEAGSVSYGKASAYRPVIDLLKGYFRVEERDDGRRIREKVAGKLLMLDRALEPLLTPLLYLLDAPLEDLEWERLDPTLRRQRILSACKQLLFRESQVQGMVIVFEDLHWIDNETQTLLNGIVDSRLAAPLASIQVPSTVQAILASRIDRLDSEDKRLLQAASVVGKDVPFNLLAAIADLSDQELRQRLANLQLAEYLYETSLYPDLEYTFKHALTHEVAYGSVLQQRRRALHRQLVEAMEARYAGRLSEHLERLALHAHRAELWDKAYVYGRQAGEKTLARSANLEAIESMTQALAAAAYLPPAPQTLKQLIDLRLILEVPLIATGQPQRLLENIQEAERLSTQLDDPVRRGRALAFLGEAYVFTGNTREAFEAGRQAVAIADRLSRPQLTGVAKLLLGITCNYCGHYSEAAGLLAASADAVRDYICPDATEDHGVPARSQTYARYGYAWAHSHGAYSFAELGQFDRSLAAGAEAIKVAEFLGISYALVGAHSFPGMAHLRRGWIADAIPAFSRALEIADHGDLKLLITQASMGLGYAHCLAGRLREAMKSLEQGVEQDAQIRNTLWSGMMRAHLAETYALAARPEDALSTAYSAIDIARTRLQAGSEAWAHYALRRVHFLAEPAAIDQASSAFGNCLRLADQLGMRPLAANAQHRLGEMYARAGERDLAHKHLDTALRMYAEMDMRHWPEQAQQALRALG